jgi:hypothetical protein
MGHQEFFGAVAITLLVGLPAAGRSESAVQGAITTEKFLATTWRLTGNVFSIMPGTGFPITFYPEGTLVTGNLGGITNWSLENGELVLSGERWPAMRFKWLPERGVFRHCTLPSRAAFFVFPEGSKNPSSIGCSDLPSAELRLRLALDKTAYQPGEPIVATATLTNIGNAPMIVHRSTDETGRSDGFRVELTKDSANALQRSPEPPSVPGFPEPLPAGGTHTRKLVLNSLLGTLKPGVYDLTLIYSATDPRAPMGVRSDFVWLRIIP